MKVKDLIKELQKMPKNADVYTADHDHSEWEHNGKVRYLELVNQNKLDQYAKEKLDRDSFFKIKGTYVTIRV